MIKVHYNIDGDILGYYPDNIGYTSIPEPYIEIDKTAHLDCINNQGLRKVDITTLKIIECEAPEIQPAQQNYAVIDSSSLNLAQAVLELSERIEKLEGGNV